uniref:Uncharacterized protein n=1 Tax=Arundo donax TaxID=35708 RepID=A0A0A9C850_ARUDO
MNTAFQKWIYKEWVLRTVTM